MYGGNSSNGSPSTVSLDAQTMLRTPARSAAEKTLYVAAMLLCERGRVRPQTRAPGSRPGARPRRRRRAGRRSRRSPRRSGRNRSGRPVTTSTPARAGWGLVEGDHVPAVVQQVIDDCPAELPAASGDRNPCHPHSSADSADFSNFARCPFRSFHAHKRSQPITEQWTRLDVVKLAGRMERLGTESAFEVLAKAKALEAERPRDRAPRDRRAGLRHPAHVVAAAQQALDKGHTHYVPAPGIPELRTAVTDFLERTGRLRTTPDRVLITPGPSRSCSSRSWRCARTATRSSTRTPGSRCTPRSPRSPARSRSRCRCARRTSSSSTPTSSRVAGHRPDQAAHPQLAAQPVRQRLDRRAVRGDRRDRDRARPGRPQRRGLLGDPVRRRAPQRARRRRHGRADGPARRLVQDVRDDRLAARLRRVPAGRWSSR